MNAIFRNVKRQNERLQWVNVISNRNEYMRRIWKMNMNSVSREILRRVNGKVWGCNRSLVEVIGL